MKACTPQRHRNNVRFRKTMKTKVFYVNLTNGNPVKQYDRKTN